MRLIYFSPVPWSSFSQRSHETVRYFHLRYKGEVLWVNPYPTRFPKLSDVLIGIRASAYAKTKIPNWLKVITPRALPIEPIPFSGRLNHPFWKDAVLNICQFANKATILGVGKPSLLALHLLSKGIVTSSFYDAMDDFPEFYRGISRLAMAKREQRTLKEVSTIITSSSALWERLKRNGKNVCLVLNACASDRLPEPGNYQNLDKQNPAVLGYIGTIARWFDWALLISMAKSYPEAVFRLIGPVYSQTPLSLPENISLEAPLSHDEAMKAMAGFDAGLIPFKRIPLTSSVDPIKYYEYRSFGLPVISSSFGEMALREESDGVFKVSRDSNIKKTIERALARGRDLENTIQFRKNNSWESRFDNADMFVL